MRPPVQVGPGKKVKPSECANCGKPTHCPDPATGNGIGCCYGTTAQDHWDKATKIARQIVEGQQESVDDLARTTALWNHYDTPCDRDCFDTTDKDLLDVLRLYADPDNWGDTNQHSKGTRWTGGGIGRGPAKRILEKIRKEEG